MAAMLRRSTGLGVLAAGLILLAGGRGLLRADEEKNPLRAELLKLNSVATEEAQTAKLRSLVKDREKAKKAVAEAAKMMKEAKDKDEKPFNINGTLIIGRAAHIIKDYDTAEKFYEREADLATKIKSGKKILNAYENLIDLYFDAKRYSEAIEKCEQIMDMTEPQEVVEAQPIIIGQMILAKARLGKVNEALNLTKTMLAQTGGHWFFLQIRGQVEREDARIDDAIKTYNEVLDKIDAEKRTPQEDKEKRKDNTRYALSGLYVENKEIDKAAKQLDILIKRHPDRATYKNDLGFIWCDNDMKLEESEKLIREALELDKKEKEKLKKEEKIDEVKENAAYLDSLGWVLFKQKKYKEALDYLKKASVDEEEGNHLEIWDHLADCYAALGQKKEAIAAWEKALKMEDISKRDGERRRKVSEKLKKARTSGAKD